ncbi:hypothetical protein Slin14017_G056630 [Septoria linicola]|nr:hypothetical protein Slin14017_G056630 [Septoria linicola]
MRKRQQSRPGDDDNGFWRQIWGAYRQHTPDQMSGGSQTMSTATATNSASTVWSTAYITIHVPTTMQWPTTVPQPSPTRLSTNSPSMYSYSAISSWPANSTISKSPEATWVTTPSQGTDIANSTVLTSLETENAAVSAAPTASATMGAIVDSLQPAQKRAIIGGLSGSIAGLVAIGLLICLILRRRRRKQEESRVSFKSSMEGEDSSPESMEKFAGFVTVMPKGSPRSSHIRPTSMTTIAVDEDHRIIRMSTRHWPRPYALGEGEGYRESAPSGQLRVVNPDLSRPNTPRRPSTETVGSYFRKQQSTVAGFVFNLPRSARQSRTEQNMRSRETPTITVVDPTLSRECVLASTTTPSSRSYPSMVSLPTIRQYPPEDPFLTPVQDSDRQLGDVATPSATSARRPSASPLQNAAGAASKTLSNLGSTLLQPFRAISNLSTPQVPQKDAHLSTSTYSSRMSRRSDPFDLDKPSIRGSHRVTGGAIDQRDQPPDTRFSLYEGT